MSETETESVEETEKIENVILLDMLKKEPKIRIELIMCFDMLNSEKVQADFISDKPVTFEFKTRINTVLMDELTAKGYKIVSTIKQGTMAYGVFQKE